MSRLEISQLIGDLFIQRNSVARAKQWVTVDSFVCHDGAGEFAYRRLGRARLVPWISICAAMREWLAGFGRIHKSNRCTRLRGGLQRSVCLKMEFYCCRARYLDINKRVDVLNKRLDLLKVECCVSCHSVPSLF